MRVLITGATGLVGSRISSLFRENGINVNYLTTGKQKIQKSNDYRGFYWDPAKAEIDVRCLEGVGAIINLAGENVFKPWTEKNKSKILNSRLDSLNLLYKTLKNNEHEVGQIVSASAIGIYSSSLQKMHFEDETTVDNSFLGEVTQKWEAAVNQFEDLGLRVAKIRIGLVLARKGGALQQMMKPFQLNLGTTLGNGKQWQSWIHIYDLARLFLHSILNGLTGAYNAVAPNPVTHREFVQQLADTMDKKLWLPKVPDIALRLAMGEMSSVILGSQLVSSQKIQDTGFSFHFVNLRQALEDLINKKSR